MFLKLKFTLYSFKFLLKFVRTSPVRDPRLWLYVRGAPFGWALAPPLVVRWIKFYWYFVYRIFFEPSGMLVSYFTYTAVGASSNTCWKKWIDQRQLPTLIKVLLKAELRVWARLCLYSIGTLPTPTYFVLSLLDISSPFFFSTII